MITNNLLGGTSVGTSPPLAQLATVGPPASSVANSWPIMSVAQAKLVSGIPLVSYLPIPTGSRILDVYIDPIAPPAAATTVSVGNESGGDTDFGTIALTGGATARVNATGGTVGAAYAGVRGNSIKVTLSIPLALMAETEKEEAPKKDAKKAEPRVAATGPDPFPSQSSPQPGGPAAGEAPGQVATQWTFGPGVKANGAGVATQAAASDMALLSTALNATDTSSVVVLSNAHPEIGVGWVLQIQSEQLSVTAQIDATHFQATRGAFATTKATHAVNVPVLIGAQPASGTVFIVLTVRYVMA